MEITKRPSGKLDFHLYTAEDRVNAYIVGEIPREKLQRNDHELMERWIAIWHLQLEMLPSSQVVIKHMRLCEEAGKPINYRTAWKDLRRANKAFGHLGSTNQKARWVILYEIQMKVLKLAEADNNHQEMNRAIKNLVSINENLPDDSNQMHLPVIMFNINVKGEGKKQVSLNDLKDIKDAEIVSIMDDLQEEQHDDETLKTMLSPSGNAGAKAQ
ncbi:MAG: hypothetical protein AAGF85_00665 [Bacteroidota bacterium]